MSECARARKITFEAGKTHSAAMKEKKRKAVGWTEQGYWTRVMICFDITLRVPPGCRKTEDYKARKMRGEGRRREGGGGWVGGGGFAAGNPKTGGSGVNIKEGQRIRWSSRWEWKSAREASITGHGITEREAKGTACTSRCSRTPLGKENDQNLISGETNHTRTHVHTHIHTYT